MSESQSFKISELHYLRVSKCESLKVSEPQSLRNSEPQNLRVSESQSLRKSESQDLGLTLPNFEYLSLKLFAQKIQAKNSKCGRFKPRYDIPKWVKYQKSL